MTYPKKSLGQNFLHDKNVINKIINLKDIQNRNVLEIGPGTGNLTNEILNRKPKTLTLIEKDSSLTKILNKKFMNYKFVKIISKDFMKVELDKILKEKTIIFGNFRAFPYHWNFPKCDLFCYINENKGDAPCCYPLLLLTI